MPNDGSSRSLLLLIGSRLFHLGFFNLLGLRSVMLVLYDAYKRKEALPLFPPNIELSRYGLVIDVGAGLGFFTRWMFSHASPDTHILSFEPAPRNFSLLRARIHELGDPDRISIYQLALSDIEGTVDFSLNTAHLGDHAVSRGTLCGNVAGRKTTKVNATTLSDVLRSAPDVPGRILLKVDVQGHELSVLAGLKVESLGGRSLDLLTEFSPDHLRVQGVDPREFFESLRGCSSRVCMRNTDGTFQQVYSSDVAISGYTDLWCEDYRPATSKS